MSNQSIARECNICYEDASTFDKTNYMIQLKPCNHWLCYTCLIASGKFNCPFCRALITFDSTQNELYQQLKKTAAQHQIYLYNNSNNINNFYNNEDVDDEENEVIPYQPAPSISQRLQERLQIMIHSSHYYMLQSDLIHNNVDLLIDHIEQQNHQQSQSQNQSQNNNLQDRI
jgi:hypothetical protein